MGGSVCVGGGRGVEMEKTQLNQLFQVLVYSQFKGHFQNSVSSPTNPSFTIKFIGLSGRLLFETDFLPNVCRLRGPKLTLDLVPPLH